MTTLEEWKNLKIEDIHYPIFDYSLRLFMDITMFISLILYCFITYIIITKSPKQMGAFKYTVLTQITFNMLFKISGYIFHPTFLFPLPALSFSTIFQNFRPNFIFVATLIILTIVATVTAIVFTVVNRVLAAFQTKNLQSSKLKYFIGVLAYILITGFMVMGIITPLKMAEPYFDQYRKTLLENVPIFMELESKYANIYVLSLSPINDYLTALVIIALFLTFAYTVTFIILNLIVLYQLRKIKKVVSKSTYGIHKMLYTAVMIQTINLLLFAVIPISMVAGGLICQKSYGNLIANVGFPISSLHLIADAPALLHFIKPYRMFVMNLIPFKKKNTVTLKIGSPSEWFKGRNSFITVT